MKEMGLHMTYMEYNRRIEHKKVYCYKRGAAIEIVKSLFYDSVYIRLEENVCRTIIVAYVDVSLT